MAVPFLYRFYCTIEAAAIEISCIFRYFEQINKACFFKLLIQKYKFVIY